VLVANPDVYHSESVLAAIEAQPGMGYAELMAAIGVKKDTAIRYVRSLGDRVDAVATGPRGDDSAVPDRRTVAHRRRNAIRRSYDSRDHRRRIDRRTVVPLYRYDGRYDDGRCL